MRTCQLTRAQADVLEALHAAGGSGATRTVAAHMPGRYTVASVTTRLETLERAGKVTSSLSLDGLERIWTIDGAKR